MFFVFLKISWYINFNKYLARIYKEYHHPLIGSKRSPLARGKDNKRNIKCYSLHQATNFLHSSEHLKQASAHF